MFIFVVKSTVIAKLSYDSKKIKENLSLPKEAILRTYGPLPFAPKTSPSYAQLQKSFHEIVQALSKENIIKQKAISEKHGGRCFLLCELMSRELSLRGYTCIHVSCIFPPESYYFSSDGSFYFQWHKSAGVIDCNNSVWLFDPWYFSELKSCNAWIQYFGTTCAIDITSTHQLIPPLWDKTESCQKNLSCSDYIKKYPDGWEELRSLWITLLPM